MLIALGIGVENRLHRADLTVPGTGSAEAAELAKKHFGEGAHLVVMVEGPPAVVERETRQLQRKLQPYDDLQLAGPWLPGSERLLRPKPGRALVLVRAERDFEDVSETIVPRLRRDIDSTVDPPARAYMTGYADVGQGIHNSTVEALKRAEMIAAPLLLIILLLVFRSPVAAAIPLLLGGATVAASRGVLDLVNRFVELDIVALNLGSMMGLALGVDYSLLMVSRYPRGARRRPAPRRRGAHRRHDGRAHGALRGHRARGRDVRGHASWRPARSWPRLARAPSSPWSSAWPALSPCCPRCS